MQLAPALLLLVAIMVDQGPAGEARASPHFFAVVLWLFDDFAWTCTRNSIIFAVLVSVASLLLGLGLRCALARLGTWGQRVFGAAVLLVSAVSPAFLALGLSGLLGEPQRWPWPIAAVDAGSAGASLESWSGISLWLLWVWSTLPAGAALVAAATEPSFRRLDPAWDEAARLAGARGPRIVRDLYWPIIRPSAARAAGLVFLLAIVEPGAPLILGLRRTLAFQIVSGATGRDPFPGTAVWALMAALLGLSGWLAFRWKGGTDLLTGQEGSMPPGFGGRSGRVRPAIAVARGVALFVWATFVWLPILGLIREAIDGGRTGSPRVEGATERLLSPISRFSDPVLVRVLLDSAVFGLVVATGIVLLAWAAGPGSRSPSAKMWRRWLRPVIELPPLVLGAGSLALPWLLGLASRFVLDRGQSRAAILLGDSSAAIDPREHAWTLMACCVGLVLLPRFYRNRRILLPLRPGRSQQDSCYLAAVLAGAARWQAWVLKKPAQPGLLLGRFVLVWALAATNLTPALLFSNHTERKTLGPAVLDLAGGDGVARSQAAALAVAAIVAMLAAVAAAHTTRALPGGRDLR
jgi:iron(III) transport system permease protein